VERGDGDAGLLQLGGEWSGVSEADGMNVPCFGLEAAGDADEGFFGTAFVEFGDDHHEGILGSVERWHVGGFEKGVDSGVGVIGRIRDA
jgi:hypothetical protein